MQYLFSELNILESKREREREENNALPTLRARVNR